MVVWATVVGFLASVFMMPSDSMAGCHSYSDAMGWSCPITLPIAVLFLLGYRSGRGQFAVQSVLLGWLVFGLLSWFLLSMLDASVGIRLESTEIVELLAILPSIGAVSWICGMRYRRRPHWKYLALAGGWLIMITYAYADYGW